MVAIPVTDAFEKLTQLNAEYAKKVKETASNDTTTACVSFVQNFEKLPVEAFAEEGSADENKAKERRGRVAINKLNEICHEVYSRVFDVKNLGKRYDFDLSEDKAWEVLREHKWDVAKVTKALKIKYNKPFLREFDFGPREFTKAALLNEDRGYLGSAGEKPFENTADFVSLLGAKADKSPAKLIEIANRDGELERVIVQDCIRTFAGEDHRQRLEVFLNGAYQEFGNYSQGMAHVAAFLLLTMTEDDVIAILRRINIEIIPGHWKHESDGFGTNAYVFQHIMSKHEPELKAYFSDPDRYLMPELYTRKWFCGLGLHCLDVEFVYRFLRCLLKRGFEYLIAFGMAVLKHLKDRVFETDGTGQLIDLLSLEEKAGVCREDQIAVLDLADKLDFTADLGTEEELKELRKTMYETHLKERLEKARAMQAAAKDDEEICECEWDGDVCDKGLPIKWVDEDNDGTPICDICKIKFEAMGHEITEW